MTLLFLVILTCACASIVIRIRRVYKRALFEIMREYSVMIDQLVDGYETLMESTLRESRTVAARANEVALVAEVMLWRQKHDIAEFNELVIWEIAETLDIDRETASSVYDRLMARGGE